MSRRVLGENAGRSARSCATSLESLTSLLPSLQTAQRQASVETFVDRSVVGWDSSQNPFPVRRLLQLPEFDQAVRVKASWGVASCAEPNCGAEEKQEHQPAQTLTGHRRLAPLQKGWEGEPAKSSRTFAPRLSGKFLRSSLSSLRWAGSLTSTRFSGSFHPVTTT